MRGSGDKGLSVGEGSNVHGDELKISTSNIGIAVKDCSDGVVTGVEIDNVNFVINQTHNKTFLITQK